VGVAGSPRDSSSQLRNAPATTASTTSLTSQSQQARTRRYSSKVRPATVNRRFPDTVVFSGLLEAVPPATVRAMSASRRPTATS